MKKKIETNRDLYLAVTSMLRADSGPDLESYLHQLLRSLLQRKEPDAAIPPGEFFDHLHGAFESGFPTFKAEELRTLAGQDSSWKQVLARQILDLQAMRAAGTLDNKMRYFGMDAPGGSRWYNFDPAGYLECAVVGSFGGWEPDDETGRQYVPGPVVVMQEDGHLTTVMPQEIESPIYSLPPLIGDDLAQFFWDGQCYE